MAVSGTDILTIAVERNSAMVLSLPSAGMLRHHRSRFLQEVEEGVWIESIPTERALIDELIGNAQPCGVSFKTGEQKVSFASKLIRVEHEYKVNTDTVLPALLIDRPGEVKAIQRRNDYRVKLPEGSDLRIKVWRIAEHARLKDKPVRGAELVLEARDLSLGGVGVLILPKDGEPPKIMAEERVRVQLGLSQDEEFIIEGRIRSLRPGPSPSTILAGIQFQKLQEGLEGRQAMATITKVVGAMNMEEVRRRRLGI